MPESVKRRLVKTLDDAAQEIEANIERGEAVPYRDQDKQIIEEAVRIQNEYDNAVDETEETHDETEKSYKMAEEDLVKFVEEQIYKMNNNLLFKGMAEPSFSALNKSLMDYESIMLALLSLHQEVRFQKDITIEKYDNFYADKYCEIKQQQVNLGKAAQFTAAREIEMFVRKTWMNELSQLKAEVIKIENKYNFINHLIDAWKNYQFILNTLSKNSQAEAMASGVASRTPKEFDDDN